MMVTVTVAVVLAGAGLGVWLLHAAVRRPQDLPAVCDPPADRDITGLVRILRRLHRRDARAGRHRR